MDILETWQRRRWRKLKPGEFEPNLSSEVIRPRIKQADVLRDHEILRTIKAGGPSRQSSIAGSSQADPVPTPRTPSGYRRTPSYSHGQSSRSASFSEVPVSPNGIRSKQSSLQGFFSSPQQQHDASSSLRAQRPHSARHSRGSSLEDVAKEQVGVNSPAHEVVRPPQAGTSILNDEAGAGGVRLILRDFQDQLQALRAQIAVLTTQNADLRNKISTAEVEIAALLNSKNVTEEELDRCRLQLLDAEADLRQTRSRELRLERLQESLKQLMDEKEAKLNNSSLNSRAVVEMTGSLKKRIGELEAQLAASQAKAAQSEALYSDQMSERKESEDAEKTALMRDFHALRIENQDLFRKLVSQEGTIQQKSQQVTEKQRDLEVCQEKLAHAADALDAAEKEKQAAQAEGAQAAQEATEAQETLAEVRSRLAAEGAASEQLDSLRSEHQQVVLQLEVLGQERDAALKQHQSLRAEFDEQLSNKRDELETLKSSSQELKQQLSHSGNQQEELKRQLREVDATQAKCRELQAEKTQLAEALHESVAQHEALLDQHNQTEECSHTLFQEKEALFQEKEEIQKLMLQAVEKLQETQAARVDLEVQIDADKHRSDNLQEAIADMTDQVQQHRKKSEALELANADLGFQNAGLKTKLEESNKLLVKSDKETSKHRKKHKTLEASLADSVNQITFWKGSAAEAERNLKSAEEQAALHKAQADRLQSSQDELLRELTEVKTASDQVHTAALAFEEDNKRLAEENHKLQDRHRQILSQLETATGTEEALQKQVEELTNANQSAQAKHRELQEQHQSVQTQLDRLQAIESNLGQTQEQLSALTTQHEKLQEAHSGIVTERGQSSEQLGELRTQHSQLQGEHDGLKGQLKEVVVQRNETSEQLTALDTEHRRLKQAHTTLRGQLTAAQGTIAISEKQVNSSKAEVEGLKSAHSENLKSLERDANESRRNLASLQTQNQELQHSHSQLERHFQELSAIVVELQELQEDASKQASDLGVENAELLKLHSQGQDHMDGLQQGRKALEQDLQELQKEHNELQASAADLENRFDQLQNVSEELQALKLRHEQLQNTHLTTCQELKSLNGDHEELQASNSSTLQELESTTGAHSQLRKEAEALKEDHKALQEVHRQTHGSLVSLRAEHDRVFQTLERDRAGAESLRQQHQELQDRHASVWESVQSLNKEHEDLSHIHTQKAQALAGLQQQHERLQAAHKQAVAQLEDSIVKEKHLQQMNASKEKLVKDLRRDLAAATTSHHEEQEKTSSMTDENRVLQTKMTQLEGELSGAKGKEAIAHAGIVGDGEADGGALQEAKQREALIDKLRLELAVAVEELEAARKTHGVASDAWEKEGADMKANYKKRKAKLKTASKAASEEVAKLRSRLDEASKTAVEQARKLEETTQSLKTAQGEAELAKQTTASLQLDLAESLDKPSSGPAVPQLQQSLQRQRELEEELRKEREVKDSTNVGAAGVNGASSRQALHQPSSQPQAAVVREDLNRANVKIGNLEKQIKAAAVKKLDQDIELRTALDALTATGLGTPSSRLQALHWQHSELRSSVTAALGRLEGSEESQRIHRDVIAKLQELTKLRAQHGDLKNAHAALSSKYKEKKAALALSHNSPGMVPWNETDRKQFAERHARLSKELQQALDRATASERQVEAQKENIVELNVRLGLIADAAGSDRRALNEAVAKAEAEKDQARSEAEDLKRVLEGTHKTHHRTVSDLQEAMKEMREAPERDHAALSFELWRLVQENDMLRARTAELEADVKKLVDTSEHLGHANPKQKLQYHMRNKQELEGLRNETTLLLRERFQLEQCIRYLAVRCGLASAVERDISNSKERTALDRLQPASLVPHYKFAPQGAHVTDAAGDHIPLEDLIGEEPGSPSGSDRASVSTTFSNKPDMAVEQQILTRVAFVCNPPANRIPANPLRPSLTPGALLAMPGSRRSDSVHSSSRKSLVNGLQACPVPLTPEQKERLKAREFQTPRFSGSSPSVTGASAPDDADPGSKKARDDAATDEKVDAENIAAANMPTKPSIAAGLAKKEDHVARLRDQNEKLGKRISRVFSGRGKGQ